MKRKVLSAFMLFVVLFSLIACGQEEEGRVTVLPSSSYPSDIAFKYKQNQDYAVVLAKQLQLSVRSEVNFPVDVTLSKPSARFGITQNELDLVKILANNPVSSISPLTGITRSLTFDPLLGEVAVKDCLTSDVSSWGVDSLMLTNRARFRMAVLMQLMYKSNSCGLNALSEQENSIRNSINFKLKQDNFVLTLGYFDLAIARDGVLKLQEEILASPKKYAALLYIKKPDELFKLGPSYFELALLYSFYTSGNDIRHFDEVYMDAMIPYEQKTGTSYLLAGVEFGDQLPPDMSQALKHSDMMNRALTRRTGFGKWFSPSILTYDVLPKGSPYSNLINRSRFNGALSGPPISPEKLYGVVLASPGLQNLNALGFTDGISLLYAAILQEISYGKTLDEAMLELKLDLWSLDIFKFMRSNIIVK